MTVFQKAIIERLQDEMENRRKSNGILANVTRIVEFQPVGAEFSKVLGETTLHWFVRTDYIEDGVTDIASWHITLFEDGNMGVRLLEIEKQN